MTQDNRGGPSSRGGKPGGDRRNGRPGGGHRSGPGKGGFGKGSSKPVRAETYETLRELTRGEGFRIDKFVLAEKGTHRPVKTEYRLFRDGVAGPQTFSNLVSAQAAATAPLPEPETSGSDAPIENAAEIPEDSSDEAKTADSAEVADDAKPNAREN
jgi:hypothetical protein